MSGKDTSLLPNRRRRGWIWLAAFALLAVVAAAVWWLRVPSGTSADLAGDPAEEIASAPAAASDAKESDLVRAANARRDSSVDKSRSPASRRDLHNKPSIVDDATPTAEAVKTLLPLAEAGRADAMREMAYRLNLCRDYINGDEASLRRIALRQFYDRNGHEPKNDVELSVIAAVINAKTAMLDHCRDLDPTLMSTRIDWMERAAKAGDVSALLGYGGNALNDMRDFDDAVFNLDEVARRRQLARDFLQSALNRGACSALVMFSLAYSGRRNPYGWLYKADPYLSLVYAEAADHGSVVSGIPPKTIDGVKDPTKRAAAAAQGAAIAAHHCNAAR